MSKTGNTFNKTILTLIMQNICCACHGSEESYFFDTNGPISSKY